jgi:hypothetical protein
MSGSAGTTNLPNASQVAAIDPRILIVQIEVSGQLQTFGTGFWIRAKGQKFANALQNTCEIEISNLDRSVRDYMLTETSPFNANRTPKLAQVFAGRQSTGAFLVYSGDITTAGITQPPDITLKLKCGTCHFKKGSVGNRQGGKITQLSTLANGVSKNLGLSLRMQTPNVNVANYSYSGNALDEVQALAQAGSTGAYVDDQQLILKPIQVMLTGSLLNLSEYTGMVGIPEITERGLKVKFLYDSSVKLGGGINVTSVLNPSANGIFVIYKLEFDLASRENDFYYTAECLKVQPA